jgi:hypothetical protein
MTAAEWQQSVDLDAMLRALDRPFREPGTIERKLRLFGAACTRRLWDALPDITRRGLELIERLADGRLGRKEHPLEGWQTPVAAYIANGLNHENIAMAAANVARATPDRNSERLIQCDLLRDLFDPLFWSLSVQPAWLSPLVRSMAQAIYDEHRFEDLPILADALEESGCDDAIVLEHCRSGRSHARGCWLVDGLLREGVTV